MVSSSVPPLTTTLEQLQNLHEVVQKRFKTHDRKRAKRRLEEAIVRGAITGLTLRGGLHVVSYVFKLLVGARRRRKGPKIANEYWPSVWKLIEDTLRWGLFLGSFSGTVVAADELIAILGGSKETSAWRGLASGALAGPTILLTGRDTTHTSLAIFILVRGLALLVRCGNLPTAASWKRILLAPTRFKHGDTVLMCLCSGQLLWSWIVLPSTLPPSFVRFLNKHGGKSIEQVNAVREMCERASKGIYHSKLTSLKGGDHANFRPKIPCEFIHPGRSCAHHSASFLPKAYLRSLRVYIPVYILPALLVHRKSLLLNKGLWRKVAFGTARSSLFLALYCTLAWAGVCTGWQLSGRATGALIAASCWISGLATLVEKKSRRMELALYCLSRAIESFGLSLIAKGIIPQQWVPKRIDVILFSIASAAIYHCYKDHDGARRIVFRSKYLEVFDFILGNEGFAMGNIKHSPSNAELMSIAGMKLARSFHSMTNMVGIRSSAIDYRKTKSTSSGSDEDIPVFEDISNCTKNE